MLKVYGTGPAHADIMIVGEAPGVPQRVWDKVITVPFCDCWIWMGSLPNGYGEVWWGNRKVKAHRFMYEAHVGPIPDGLVLDHLCRNPCCCNPTHLEPVTESVNIKRGTAWHHVVEKNKAATHCQRGHAWTQENTYTEPNGKRRCLSCKRMRMHNWRARHGKG